MREMSGDVVHCFGYEVMIQSGKLYISSISLFKYSSNGISYTVIYCDVIVMVGFF